MRLEFSYKGHRIKLLSFPYEEGWLAKFQVEYRLGGQDMVHLMNDPSSFIYATLEQANQSATQMAILWIEPKILRLTG